MRPNLHPLAVRLGRNRRHQRTRQIGVYLDRGRVRALGTGDRQRQVRLCIDRLLPRHLARDGAPGDRLSPAIVEEAGPGHQSSVENVRSGDFANARLAGDVRDLAKVVGHVPGGRDAAVDVALQKRLGLRPVWRSREMLVRVDQARKQVFAREIDDLRAD